MTTQTTKTTETTTQMTTGLSCKQRGHGVFRIKNQSGVTMTCFLGSQDKVIEIHVMAVGWGSACFYSMQDARRYFHKVRKSLARRPKSA